jgi:hypothetical protein
VEEKESSKHIFRSMMNKIDLHDSCILSINYNDELSWLLIGIRTSNGDTHKLTFKGVHGWIFSPFEMQNVLFDFKIFEYDKIPEHIYEDYDEMQQYADIITSNKCKIAVLNPSVGLGGVILFQDLSLAGARL